MHNHFLHDRRKMIRILCRKRIVIPKTTLSGSVNPYFGAVAMNISAKNMAGCGTCAYARSLLSTMAEAAKKGCNHDRL